MANRTRPYGEVDDDLPVRDRPYESFGQQGVALPTYGEEPPIYGEEPEGVRGAERVELGEPVADIEPRMPSGPKGWQRRDDRIHDDVCAHLTEDSYVDASNIEVIVHHGEVILNGTVSNRMQRDRAIHIAETARGVVDVIRRLRVAPDDERDDGGSKR